MTVKIFRWLEYLGGGRGGVAVGRRPEREVRVRS